MWMSYLAICLPRRIKKRPIVGRSANKRMVGRKLEMDQTIRQFCFVLFDLILYVHSTIFQLCGTNLPGLNQY